MTSRTQPTPIKLTAIGSFPMWLKQFTLAANQKGLAPYLGLQGQGFVYQPPLRLHLAQKIADNLPFTDEEHKEFTRWNSKDNDIREKKHEVHHPFRGIHRSRRIRTHHRRCARMDHTNAAEHSKNDATHQSQLWWSIQFANRSHQSKPHR